MSCVGFQTLSRLALVCHRFHSIIKPFLFANIQTDLNSDADLLENAHILTATSMSMIKTVEMRVVLHRDEPCTFLSKPWDAFY